MTARKLKEATLNLFDSFWISLWWFSIAAGLLGTVLASIIMDGHNEEVLSALFKHAEIILILWGLGSIISMLLLFLNYQYDYFKIWPLIGLIFACGLLISTPVMLLMSIQT